MSNHTSISYQGDWPSAVVCITQQVLVTKVTIIITKATAVVCITQSIGYQCDWSSTKVCITQVLVTKVIGDLMLYV